VGSVLVAAKQAEIRNEFILLKESDILFPATTGCGFFVLRAQ
jgi:hypothetical protein